MKVTYPINAGNAYIENMIKTASPAKLVEMLYVNAVDRLKRAAKFIKDNDIAKATEQISKVESIILELNISLDMEKGGEIAKHLRALYNYMYRRLLEANMEKSISKVEEVRELLQGLLEAWREAMKRAGDITANRATVNRKGGLNISS